MTQDTAPERIWAVTEPDDVSAQILGEVYAQQTPEGMVGKPVEYVRKDLFDAARKVKDLVWKHREPPATDVDNLFGEVCRAETPWDEPYIIYDDSLCNDGEYLDDESHTIWFYGNEFHPSVEDAKAAAQADYERRILSALDQGGAV